MRCRFEIKDKRDERRLQVLGTSKGLGDKNLVRG